MSSNSKIEWCDASWNPIRSRVRQDAPEIARAKGYTSLIQIVEKNIGKVGWHCEHASTGCDHCYAESLNHRCLPGCGTGLPYDRRSRDLVELFLDEEELLKPLKWKKPRRIFVCSMTDLFAEFVTDEMIDQVMAVAALCPQHTFLFLTKRTDRCAEYWDNLSRIPVVFRIANAMTTVAPGSRLFNDPRHHCHLGFSAEDQQRFDERWSHMRKLAAAGWKVWCSAEPLLSAIDLRLPEGASIHANYPEGFENWTEKKRDEWFSMQARATYMSRSTLPCQIVVGGESGHGARPCNIDWIRGIVRQCRDAGVAVFVKQLGAKPYEVLFAGEAFGPFDINGQKWLSLELDNRKGADMAEWPEDLRIREIPGGETKK